MVKSWYVLIPIYFIVFALKFAPIRNSQLEINKAIDNNKQIATDFAYSFLNSIVSDSLLDQRNSAEDIVNNYLDAYVYNADSATQPSELNFAERFFFKVKRIIEFSFLKKIVESKIIKKTSKLVGLDDSSVKTIYSTDLHDLFKDGEIIDIFKIEINRYFNKFYRLSFLLFSLGLLIPAIEIILAKTIKY